MTSVSVVTRLGGIFDFDVKKEELDEVTRELEQPDVWNDPERAQKLGQERARLEAIVFTIQKLDNGLTDARELLDMAVEEEDDDLMGNEPYIDTLRCTSCDDCLKVNPKVFVYNDDQQAEIGDAKAGTFKQLVMAAEACPAECIHPGDPMNPKEKGLDKLIKRAEPFN